MRLISAAFAALLLGGLAMGGPRAQSPEKPAEPSCSPANAACQCSFSCCGEERCDGSICNQCVIDCVERHQVIDKRATSLRARCHSLMTRGFKRL